MEGVSSFFNRAESILKVAQKGRVPEHKYLCCSHSATSDWHKLFSFSLLKVWIVSRNGRTTSSP